MTDPLVPQNPAFASPRVRFPGMAIVLIVVASILLLLGTLTILGTSSRSFFVNAPTQASLGMIFVLVGAVALVGALVLVGIRSIAQQHIDLLLHKSPGSR